ncbi:rab-GTPase-TBC domain-containing protein [Flagelloscypha sp. PMI_526]|nr:rab-GTPase-TBC domain-containing protein [Flagelloscypha sp. PMI_526]
MQQPDVVLVPASPSPSNFRYPRPSPPSSSLDSSSSQAYGSLDLPRPSQSSDSTLYSLYTMYSDEPNGNATVKAPTARVLEVTVNGQSTLNPPIRNSSLKVKNSYRPPAEDVPLPASVPPSPSPSTSPALTRRTPSPSPRPESFRRSLAESSVYHNAYSRPTSFVSRPSSVARTPSPSHTPTPGPSSRPASIVRQRAPPPLSPVGLSPSPSANPNPALKSSSTVGSIPQTPRGDNEEVDAHHVRSTYAMLETVGVSHDGFTEGVERTRSRSAQNLISSRDSELLLQDAALGGAAERRRDLDPNEVKVLGALDRYGFFDNDTVKGDVGERIVILPAAPFSSPLTKGKDKASATVEPPKRVSKIPPPPSLPKEGERTEKWTRMLEPESRDFGGNAGRWRVKAGKNAKLRRRIYKGVPDRWRGAVWEMLIHARSGQPAGDKEKEYHERLAEPSSFDVQIDLDVPRTIGGHIMFKTRYGTGQRSLFHVLHSFSLYCSTCGYVQGMGPITSTLLLYLPPSHVYELLTLLHSPSSYNLHSTFSPGFPGLMENVYLTESLIRLYMPSVYDNLKNVGVNSLGWITRGFITMFVNGMGFQSILRIWDVWILEGEDFWPVLACAVVFSFRDWLSEAKRDFESVLSLLSSFFVVEDDDALVTLDWHRAW